MLDGVLLNTDGPSQGPQACCKTHRHWKCLLSAVQVLSESYQWHVLTWLTGLRCHKRNTVEYANGTRMGAGNLFDVCLLVYSLYCVLACARTEGCAALSLHLFCPLQISMERSLGQSTFRMLKVRPID